MHEQTRRILEKLDIDIDPRRIMGTMPVAERQMAEIAKAVSYNARIIVLDEPTAMLDPKGRAEVMDTVKRLNSEKGITVILITHHMDEAAQAQRVVVLDKGKVALDGAPWEVFSQVEKLHSMGLAAPETVELCSKLNAYGFTLPLDRVNVEDCAQVLCENLKA